MLAECFISFERVTLKDFKILLEKVIFLDFMTLSEFNTNSEFIVLVAFEHLMQRKLPNLLKFNFSLINLPFFVFFFNFKNL